MQLNFNLACVYRRGGTGHENARVTTCPSYREFTTTRADRHTLIEQAPANTGDNRRTSAAAARQRFARTTLPHPQAYVGA